MDKVIAFLQNTLAGTEGELMMVNEQIEKGDYSGSKKDANFELKEQRYFAKQLRSAIKHLKKDHVCNSKYDMKTGGGKCTICGKLNGV